MKVIYFGGFGATAAQVDAWVKSAKTQKPEYDFEGIQYFSQHSDEDSAVAACQHTIAHWAQTIDADLEGSYTIVGHSSGCACSNELARQIRKNKNVKLIILDGFIPSKDLQEKYHAEAWYAFNPDAKILSLNAATMKYNGLDPKEHIAKAETIYSLHFSLVNENIAPELTRSTWIAYGYDHIKAFLGYLDEAIV